VAHSLRVRFNTRYLWIGLDVSCENPDWIGLDWVSKNELMQSNSAVDHAAKSRSYQRGTYRPFVLTHVGGRRAGTVSAKHNWATASQIGSARQPFHPREGKGSRSVDGRSSNVLRRPAGQRRTIRARGPTETPRPPFSFSAFCITLYVSGMGVDPWMDRGTRPPTFAIEGALCFLSSYFWGYTFHFFAVSCRQTQRFTLLISRRTGIMHAALWKSVSLSATRVRHASAFIAAIFAKFSQLILWKVTKIVTTRYHFEAKMHQLWSTPRFLSWI